MSLHLSNNTILSSGGGAVVIPGTAVSTSTATGALVVAGGVGVAGTSYFGTINSLTVTGLAPPIQNFDAANKAYVDSKLQSIFTNLQVTNETVANLIVTTLSSVANLAATAATTANLYAPVSSIASLLSTSQTAAALVAASATVPSLTVGAESVGASTITALAATASSIASLIAVNSLSTTATATNLRTTSSTVGSAMIGSATITTATIPSLVTTAASAAALTATAATIPSLATTSATASSLTVTAATATNLFAAVESVGSLLATNASATNLIATTGSIPNLYATSATITSLLFPTAAVTNLRATNETVTNLIATVASASSLLASSSTLGGVTASAVTAGSLVVTAESVGALTATTATVPSLYAPVATAGVLTVTTATTISLVATNSSTTNLVATSSTVGSLLAPIITVTNLHTTNDTVTALLATTASASSLLATSSTLGGVTVSTATMGSVVATSSSIAGLVATAVTAATLNAPIATAVNLTVTAATAANLYAPVATAGTLTVTNATATNLVATSSSIANLVAPSSTMASLFAPAAVVTTATIPNLLTTSSTISSLFAPNILATDETVNNLIVTTGSIADLYATSATILSLQFPDTVSLTNFKVTNETVGNLIVTTVASLGALYSDAATMGEMIILGGTAAAVVITSGTATSLAVGAESVGASTIADLYAPVATAGTLTVTDATAVNLVTTSATATNLVATSATIAGLQFPDLLTIDNLRVTNETASTLIVTTVSSIANLYATSSTMGSSTLTNATVSNMLVVTSTIPSFSITTGALMVAGGLGVSGDMYAGSSINTPYISGSSPYLYPTAVGYVIDSAFGGGNAGAAADGTVIVGSATANGAMIYSLDPFYFTLTPVQTLTVSGGSGYGANVAISDDGNTIVIVSGNNDHPQYVYTRTNFAPITWTLTGSIDSHPAGSGGTPQDTVAVNMSSDGQRVIFSGLSGATIYSNTASNWVLEATLVGSGGSGSSEYEIAVALSKDGNTAAFGVPNDSNSFGAVWVFARTTSSVWNQQGSKIVPPGGSGSPQFGYSVGLSYDGDNMIVGGPADAGGIGSTWFFLRSGDSWNVQGPKYSGTGGGEPYNLGETVAIDSSGTRAIAGPGSFSNSNFRSMIFLNTGSNWTSLGLLDPPVINATYYYFAEVKGWANLLLSTSHTGKEFQIYDDWYQIPMGIYSNTIINADTPMMVSSTVPTTAPGLGALVVNGGIGAAGLAAMYETVGDLIVTNNASMASLSITAVTSTNLVATNETVSNIFATSATASSLLVTSATAANFVVTNETARSLITSNILATSATASSLLVTTSATAANLVVTSETAGSIVTSNILATSATASSFHTASATATNLVVTDETAGSLVASNILATSATASSLLATSETAINLLVTNETATNLLVTSSTFNRLVVTTGSVTNLSSTSSTLAELLVPTAATVGNLVTASETAANLLATNATILSLFANAPNLIVTNETITNLITTTASVTNLLATSETTASLRISSTVPSTSYTTGALVVAGGMGIGGDIFGPIVNTLSIVGTSTTLLPFVTTGGALAGGNIAMASDRTIVVGNATANGALIYSLAQDNSTLIPLQTLVAPTGSRYGGIVTISDDGDTIMLVSVANEHPQYVYTRDTSTTWIQTSSMDANPAGYNDLGIGVIADMSADGTRTIFSGKPGVGATVYSYTSSSWILEATLVGTGISGTFASVVAMSADGNTVGIGAPGDNGNFGAMWVFSRTTSSAWNQQGSKIIPPGGSGTPQFGDAMALSSDGNNIIVGGYNDAGGEGSIWFFVRSGDVWTNQGPKYTGTIISGFGERIGLTVAMNDSGTMAIGGASAGRGGFNTMMFINTGSQWTSAGLLAPTSLSPYYTLSAYFNFAEVNDSQQYLVSNTRDGMQLAVYADPSLVVSGNTTIIDCPLAVASTLPATSLAAGALIVAGGVAASSAYVTNLLATTGSVTNLLATSATIDNLLSTNITTANLIATTSSAANLLATSSTIASAVVTIATVPSLVAGTSTIGDLYATSATITALQFPDVVSLTNLHTTNETASTLIVTAVGSMAALYADTATVGGMVATTATVTNLLTTSATATNLVAADATVPNLLSTSSTVASAVVTTATVSSLVAGASTVGDLFVTTATATNLLTTSATATNLLVTATTSSTSTATGALIVAGGMGVAGTSYMGPVISEPSYVSVAQTAHGFSAGQWLYLNGSTYALAVDTSIAAAEVVGIVFSVLDADTFILQKEGYCTSSGLSGLTAGQVYYLSTEAGAMMATSEATVGNVNKPLFIADSATSGYISNYRGEYVSDTTTISTIGELCVATSLLVTATTVSTSTITGALVVAGGIGAASIYATTATIGDLTATGATIAALDVSGATPSTSTATGALTVAGGVGVGGASYLSGAYGYSCGLTGFLTTTAINGGNPCFMNPTTLSYGVSPPTITNNTCATINAAGIYLVGGNLQVLNANAGTAYEIVLSKNYVQTSASPNYPGIGGTNQQTALPINLVSQYNSGDIVSFGEASGGSGTCSTQFSYYYIMRIN